MTSNLVIPPLLKAVKPYITLAGQLEQKDDAFVAYYMKLFALQHGMSINKSDPECKKFLLQLMDMLEAMKSQYKNEEAVQSQVVGQALVEKLALSIFHKADAEDRDAKFTKNLVKQFYSAGLLFDSLSYFGDLSEDLIAKKQYAKRKAMYLNRCFQTGETPIPGPLIGEDIGDSQQNEEEGQSSSTGASYYPPAPSNYNQPPQPVPQPRSNQISDNSYYNEQPAPASDSASISPEQLLKAQKLCKFAGSALQYEDIPTAITNLEQCLSLLRTGK